MTKYSRTRGEIKELGGYGKLGESFTKPRNENRLKRFEDYAAAFGRTGIDDDDNLIKKEEANIGNAAQRLKEAPKRAMRNLKRFLPKNK